MPMYCVICGEAIKGSGIGAPGVKMSHSKCRNDREESHPSSPKLKRRKKKTAAAVAVANNGKTNEQGDKS